MLNFLKLDINILNDQKIQIIRSYPAGDSLFVVWVWILCAAMQSDRPGYIYITQGIPYTAKEIAAALNVEVKTVELALELFTRFKMIEIMEGNIIEVINFNRHQKLDKIEASRIASRESSKKYREKQRQEILRDNEVTVTYTSRDDNDTNSDDTDKTKTKTKTRQDLDKDLEKDKIKKPQKNKYLEYVLLTSEEYNRLCESYDKKIIEDYIERLNSYIGSKGKKYKSHYYTILSWLRMANVEKLKKPKRCPHCKTILVPGGLCRKCDIYINKADQIE